MSAINGGNELKAGAARADITPAMGIQLAGDIGRHRPAEEIRDPLYAKALVLDSGAKRFCWLALDILAIGRVWGDRLRQEAAAICGISPEAVMVHILQNHAAPAVGHFFNFDERVMNPLFANHAWLPGGDDRYNPVCFAGAVQAVKDALAALEPVSLEVGRGVDGRVAFNRRFIMRDGRAIAHPPVCDPGILQCEGPADPEVGVMTFKSKAGAPVATVLHHTCHPVHGYPQRWVSAGWPGAWCDRVRELQGDRGVVMVLNGFCGNIHHTNHLDPTQADNYQEMGRKLAETTAKVLKQMVPVENPSLDWRAKWMKIPFRRLTAEELSAARKLIEEHPEPIWKDATKTSVDWGWVYAACRLDMAGHIERNPFCDYFVQAFRLGGIGIVAVPGEPFVQEQLRIKGDSPFAYTFMAHMSNHYVGYLPTPEAILKDSFETRTCIGSRLVPEALRLMGDQSLSFLRELSATMEK